MASYGFEYTEPLDPALLRAERQAACQPSRRYQDSLLAASERRLLAWLAQRTPAWVNSDHLTLLGFGAQMVAGLGYGCARWNRWFLLLVIVALAFNWLGDSLDGTVARYRNRQRPRYGFYLDHMVDSLGSVALMGGLALSGYMHPAIAIGLLVAFLLLSIQSYLATHTLGEFHLSFWHFGPTELRILLAVGNVALFFRPMVHFRGGLYRLLDVGGVIGFLGMALMLVVWTAQNTLRLYRAERLG